MPRHTMGFNAYRTDGNVTYLTLVTVRRVVSGEAIIDTADLPMLVGAGDRWFLRSKYVGHFRVLGDVKTATYLHRVISGLQGGMVDHINGNPLDNRRANLRPADSASNGWNRGATAANTTGFKGVCQCRNGRFVARIGAHRTEHYLGYYTTAEEAARAYDAAALRLHGEFAWLNFPAQEVRQLASD